MAKAHERWTVLEHGPIQELSSRVRRVEGALPGMPLRRVMTVARMDGDRLVVHNAVALAEDAMKTIDAWGEVAFIVVPNGYHRLDAAAFKARYPTAKVLCPPGARARVAEVVEVSGSYDDLPPDPHVSLVVLDGCKEREGVMLVRDEAGATLVFNDALFNMPHLPGLAGFVFRYVTQSSGGPKVTRIAKLFIVSDKPAFAAHLERLADTPDLKRIIVSHHETIESDPAKVLRDIAATLR